MKDGILYIACWEDIEAVYNEERTASIRLTKFLPETTPETECSFCVPSQKTASALSTLTLNDKLCISEGTIILVTLIVDWFHMMNVTDGYSGVKFV